MSTGWRLMASNYGVFLGATLIDLVFALVLAFVPIVGPLTNLFLGPPLAAGWAFMGVKAYRGDGVRVEDLFRGFDRFGAMLGIAYLLLLMQLVALIPAGLGFLVGSMVDPHLESVRAIAVIIVGCLITVVALLTLWLRFGLAQLACLETGFGVIDSLKRSWAITGPIAFGLLGLFFVMLLAEFVSCMLLVLPFLFLFLPFSLGVIGAAYGLAADQTPGSIPGARAVRLRAPGDPESGRSVLGTWLVSAGLHALMLFIMLHVAWFATGMETEDDVPFALTEMLGDIETPRLTMESSPDFSKAVPEAVTEPLEVQPKPMTDVDKLTGSKKPDLQVIGIATGGADFSKFGLTAGEGPAFFNTGGAKARGARRVAYVIDRSGSMIDTFDLVCEELRNSVGRLRRSQKFHVIFFNSGPPLEFEPKRLVSALPSQKEKLAEFLETVRPEGSTNPTQAMQRAFQVKPDLIFFLTDGAFQPSLLDKLRAWNRSHRVRIFTIAYNDPEGRVLLERIARENGGEFKYVSLEDDSGP